jgi:hypothetical protein
VRSSRARCAVIRSAKSVIEDIFRQTGIAHSGADVSFRRPCNRPGVAADELIVCLSSQHLADICVEKIATRIATRRDETRWDLMEGRRGA